MATEQQISPLGAVLFALAFFGAGGSIVALSLNYIPLDPAKLHAPRWVLTIAGLMFIAGGCVPLGTAFNFRAWVNQLIGLTVASSLAIIFNWVAFFPGERHFNGSTYLLGIRFGSASGGDISGRILFGIFALFINWMLFVWLYQFIHGLRQSNK